MWEKPLITWRKSKVWHTMILCCSPFLWLWGPTLSFPYPTAVLPGSGSLRQLNLLGWRGGHAKMRRVQRSWKRWESSAQQEGLWKGTACKPRLLFQALDEESCDPSGVSDETVKKNNKQHCDRRQRIHQGHLQLLNFDTYLRPLVHFMENVTFPA